jgi:hypothetical protein
LHEKDVVYLCDDRVGIVRKFWYNYSSDAIVVVMQLLRRVDENVFDTSYNSEIVVDACMVADATMWFDVAPGQIHVIKPVRAMFS